MMTLLKPQLLAIGTLTFLAACTPNSQNNPIIAEGVLFSVEYKLGNDTTGGFTRLNSSKAVPGGNGSWNIDAYGQLTRDYLIITRPQQKDLGKRIIPAHRLVDVQFGDGGITVTESQPASPN